jgi:hypothetical protein
MTANLLGGKPAPLNTIYNSVFYYKVEDLTGIAWIIDDGRKNLSE